MSLLRIGKNKSQQAAGESDPRGLNLKWNQWSNSNLMFVSVTILHHTKTLADARSARKNKASQLDSSCSFPLYVVRRTVACVIVRSPPIESGSMDIEKPVRICVICAVWNAEQWIGKCIDSIREQTYGNFRCAVVDDCSDDNTYRICRDRTQGDSRFVVQENDSRIRSVANQLAAVELIASDPEDVLVIVDGDDWLRHAHVFEHLARLYSTKELWLTYGSFQLWRNRLSERLGRRCERGHVEPYPDYVAEHNLYRYHPFMASHLRTFRRFLWDRIKQDDLKDDMGEYLQVAHDVAAMIPMLEMAGPSHSRYVDEMLYVYNYKNPHSIHRNRRDDEYLIELQIRARPRYWPL